MRPAVPLASLLLLLLIGRVAADPGLPFLRLGAGARGAALAGAETALSSAEAAAVNPAGLQARRQRSIGLAHSAWIQDIRHDYLSLAFAAGETTWGLAAQLSQADDLERRVGPSAEPLGVFGVYAGALSLTWARPWGARLRAGASLKLIRQAIAAETASGAAVDLGILCDLSDHLRLGMALRDLGRLDDLDRSATDLPSALRLGMAYAGLSRFLFSAEAQRVRGGSTTLHLGTECAVDERLTLRAGYQNADARGLAAGLGLAIGDWNVDYAFVPFGSGLGEAHRLSVQLHR